MRVVVGRVREADAGEESKFHTELGILSLCICLPHDWWISEAMTEPPKERASSALPLLLLLLVLFLLTRCRPGR